VVHLRVFPCLGDANLNSSNFLIYMKNIQMVPGAGIEPARLAAGDFESPASTNFTTRAGRAKLGIIAHLKTLFPPPQFMAAG
jgi:hypothetical protein